MITVTLHSINIINRFIFGILLNLDHTRKALSRFSKQDKQTFTSPLLHNCTPLTQNTVTQADQRWSTKLSKWFNHGTSSSITDPDKRLQDMML